MVDDLAERYAPSTSSRIAGETTMLPAASSLMVRPPRLIVMHDANNDPAASFLSSALTVRRARAHERLLLRRLLRGGQAELDQPGATNDTNLLPHDTSARQNASILWEPMSGNPAARLNELEERAMLKMLAIAGLVLFAAVGTAAADYGWSPSEKVWLIGDEILPPYLRNMADPAAD